MKLIRFLLKGQTKKLTSLEKRRRYRRLQQKLFSEMQIQSLGRFSA